MREIDAGEIQSIQLFADMANGELDALLEAASLKRFSGRAALIKEGEDADFLHILLEGSAELFARMNDRQTTITLFRPVRAFFLPAVVTGLPYPVSARTLGPAHILMIPAGAVRSALNRDAAFAHAVFCALANEFSTLLADLKNLKLRTSVERLAAWLLRTNARLGENGRFTLPFEKRTLASRLGMTPENLSRNFKALANLGVVVRGREVTINDARRLAKLARVGPLTDAAELRRRSVPGLASLVGAVGDLPWANATVGSGSHVDRRPATQK
jgi:CRP/FNR family transcriptional regulator, transcriptional activator FtrB